MNEVWVLQSIVIHIVRAYQNPARKAETVVLEAKEIEYKEFVYRW